MLAALILATAATVHASIVLPAHGEDRRHCVESPLQ